MKCLRLLQFIHKSAPVHCLQQQRRLHISAQNLLPRFQTTNQITTAKSEKNEIEILEQIEQNLFESPKNTVAQVFEEPMSETFERKPQKTKKRIVVEEPETEEFRFDEKLGLKFKQLDRHDKRLSSVMAQINNKREPKILLEGARLIDDALETGLPLRTILFSRFEQVHRIRNRLVMNEQAGSQHELIKIENSDMKIWSNLTTSPGIIGIFDRPKKSLPLDSNDLPITVICDQIREPANLGSIIRVAASIPCQQLICVKGTTDPWSAKSLRGGAGGHFRIPIKQMEWPEIVNSLPINSHYFIAENNALRQSSVESSVYNNINLAGFSMRDQNDADKSHVVVVIGGETHGVSHEALNYSPQNQAPVCLHIPLANNMDSLNSTSAISVILFEIRRKLLELQAKERTGQDGSSSDSDDEKSKVSRRKR